MIALWQGKADRVDDILDVEKSQQDDQDHETDAVDRSLKFGRDTAVEDDFH